MQYLPFERWNGDIGLVSADGKELINLTESGYECSRPKWVMGGEAIIWFSGRNGMKSHGSWGSQGDAYAMFLTEGAYDQFNLSEAELKQMKADSKTEDKKKADKTKKEKSKKKKSDEDDEEASIELLEFDMEKAKDRTKRLTIHSSSLSDAILTKDGSKLFYLSSFEKGFDLWVQDFKKNETKLLAKLGTSYGYLKFDEVEANVIVITNRSIKKISVKGGAPKPVAYSAKVELNQQEEFEYIFNHAWRQTLKNSTWKICMG